MQCIEFFQWLEPTFRTPQSRSHHFFPLAVLHNSCLIVIMDVAASAGALSPISVFFSSSEPDLRVRFVALCGYFDTGGSFIRHAGIDNV
jgi:acyl-coenzyme A thioesterase PaaI-like protein